MRKAKPRRRLAPVLPDTKAPAPMNPGVLIGEALDREVAELQARLDSVRARIKLQREPSLPAHIFVVPHGAEMEIRTTQALLNEGDRVGIYQLVRTRTLRIINHTRTLVDE